jgi:hypothetical protein
MLSVYSRHYPPRPSDDINYKRCRCPKWINGILESDGPSVAAPRPAVGKMLRISNGSWKRKYEAKERGLEEASRPEPALVTVKEAVAHFLNNKRNENLADSTREIKGSRQPVYRTQIGPKLADPECTIGLWVMSETMSFPPPAIERRLYLLKLI